MQVVHRITLSSSPAVQAQLAAAGVEVAASGLVTLELTESDATWPAVQQWLTSSGAADLVSTRFTPAEIKRAAWLELVPAWQHTYPQPEDGFAYLGVTYDLSDRCPTCGIGAEQTAPFRMKREPVWGTRGILQLHWVPDQFFTTPQVHQQVLAPLGIGARPVQSASR